VVSLIFWAWILGPIGALVAVPLTMVVKEIFLESFEETRGLALLMGGGDGSIDEDSEAASN
jgi:predicted PurR-regulated permease PerM